MGQELSSPGADAGDEGRCRTSALARSQRQLEASGVKSHRVLKMSRGVETCERKPVQIFVYFCVKMKKSYKVSCACDLKSACVLWLERFLNINLRSAQLPRAVALALGLTCAEGGRAASVGMKIGED